MSGLVEEMPVKFCPCCGARLDARGFCGGCDTGMPPCPDCGRCIYHCGHTIPIEEAFEKFGRVIG